MSDLPLITYVLNITRINHQYVNHGKAGHGIPVKSLCQPVCRGTHQIYSQERWCFTYRFRSIIMWETPATSTCFLTGVIVSVKYLLFGVTYLGSYEWERRMKLILTVEKD